MRVDTRTLLVIAAATLATVTVATGAVAGAADGTAVRQVDDVTVADGDANLTDGATVWQGQEVVGTGPTAVTPGVEVEVRAVTQVDDDGDPVRTRLRDRVTADADGQYLLDSGSLEAGDYVVRADGETVAEFELAVQTLSVEFDEETVENEGEGGSAVASASTTRERSASATARSGTGTATATATGPAAVTDTGVPAGLVRAVADPEPDAGGVGAAPDLHGLVEIGTANGLAGT
jgi:hypothetical protein